MTVEQTRVSPLLKTRVYSFGGGGVLDFGVPGEKNKTKTKNEKKKNE